MRKTVAALVIWLAACSSGPDDRQPFCVDDGHEDGPPCLEHVSTSSDFETIAVESTQQGRIVHTTKFMVPAIDRADLSVPIFQNSKRFKWHICFLCCAIPEFFGPCKCEGLGGREESCASDGGITTTEYMQLILKRATREYYAGQLTGLEVPGAGYVYGFDLWTDSADTELMDMKEIRGLYQAILQEFEPETLVYMPSDPAAIRRAQTWIDPDFPVYLGFDQINTEVYTGGTCYGRVRRFALPDLEEAIRQGELSWQDIVVVDRVPFDIETVVAGVVTGGRQWELSHVNIRMARRGTPNLYVREALSNFEEYEDQLVKLEAIVGVNDDSYRVSQATLEEAEAWWTQNRPNLGSAPAIDRDHRDFAGLLEMDTDDQPVPLISRFGGKTANLAKLFDFLPEAHRVPGFGIPFAFFEDFMQQNTILDQRVDPPEEVSFREYVDRLVADERFRTDAPYRRDLLWDLRVRMQQPGLVDQDLLSSLAHRIPEIFGGSFVKVRFRSSSNVEDALEFSGAGLYSSTSVCADDSLDDDDNGPSRCDLTQDEERSIERGLTRVWSSLYNARAWEERDWYQVPQEQASMAILVSLAFSDEQANGVAFTGNPAKTTDNRYMINVQVGDQPVVGNDPRMVPERDFLTLDPETGEVTNIYRNRSSALADPGTFVLSDEQLTELGELMFIIESDYPVDSGDYLRTQVLWDLEFKIDAPGALRFKQIRPYLDENRCRKIVCNQPPANFCKDETTLNKYRAWGLCEPETGDCSYEITETHCENGCLNNECQ